MNYLQSSVLLAFALIIISSCSSDSNQPWTKAIPADAAVVITPAENAQLDSTLTSDYGSLVDQITLAGTDLLRKVDSTLSAPVGLHAILLYPGEGNKLSSVWIAQAPAKATDALKQAFHRDYMQNNYQFGDHTIQRLHVKGQSFFFARISDILLLSESSLGIEEAIRAYSGSAPRANLSRLSVQPNHLILNTPALDSGIHQLAQVKFYPAIKGAFTGTAPALLSLKKHEDEFQFSGTIPLTDDNPEGALTKALTGANAAIMLDKYISSNAAGFGLFRQAPPEAFSGPLPDTTNTDRHLMQEEELYSSIAQQTGNRFALVLYAESGFMTEGEELYLRELSDAQGFTSTLAELKNEELITSDEGTYYIQSNIIGDLMGGSLNTLSAFYLKISDGVAILSERKELTEMVVSDKDRRRTMYYEQQFRQIKNGLPEKVSSLFVTTDNFKSYITPFILPDSYAPLLLSKFRMLSISTALNEDGTGLNLRITNHNPKKKVSPTRNSGSTQPKPDSPASRP